MTDLFPINFAGTLSHFPPRALFGRSESTAFRLVFTVVFLFCVFLFPRYWKKGTPLLYYSHSL